MCYSLLASVLTGTLAYTTVIWCWIRNATYRDRWNAIWVFLLGSMQWYDAYIWYLHDNNLMLNEDGGCAFNNWLITKIALTTVMFEPLGSLLAYMYASRKFLGYKIILFYIFWSFLMPIYGRKIFGIWSDSWCGSSDNYCCSYITAGSQSNIMYGLAADSNSGYKCWNKYYFFGSMQAEIPLLLRVFFLLGIIYPYLRYSNPYTPGIINSLLIILSWFLGYYSSAHASVWCWGASLQSIYCLIDPYLFQNGYDVNKKNIFQYHQIGTKENKINKKLSLKTLQNRYLRSKIPKRLDAIVIGSGIGGLTTAALLSRAGKRVLVLEQHYRAGGCMHTFDEFGGEFDSGIHYVGAINRIQLFLSFITNNLIEWYSMGTNNDNIYDTIDLDGFDFKKNVIQYRGGKTKLMNELITKFPNQKVEISNYFKFLKKYGGKITYLYVLSKIVPNLFIFNENGFIYKKFVYPIMKYTKMTANQVIDQYITDPKLKAIIGGGQLIDWCLIPSKASWWVVAAMMNYYIDGGYYPQGGSNNIPMSIIPVIRASGGDVLCRAKVSKILIKKGKNGCNRAYGVCMDKSGDIIKAKMIISGVGSHTLWRELLSKDDDDIASKNEELQILEDKNELVPSLGHMTAFITFNGTSSSLNLPDYNIHSWGNLNKYNYNISKIQELFYLNPFKYGDEALICLTFPSAKDPYYNIKFPNKSSALLLTEAPFSWFKQFESGNYNKRTENYKKYKEKFKKMFLNRLFKYCPETSKKGIISSIEIGTPLSSEYFLNTYRGGSYGLSWNTSRFKHSYTKKYFNSNATNIKKLYITGESSLFGGFVGALFSGYITTIKILGVKNMCKILLNTVRVEE